MARYQILGFEASSGVGKTSNKPYDMGRLFTIAELAPAMGNGVAAGYMGMEVQCKDSEVIRAIRDVPLPFYAECDVRTVMRFGKPEQMCFAIKPEPRPAK